MAGTAKATAGKALGTSQCGRDAAVLVTADHGFTEVSGLEVERGRGRGAGSQTQTLSHSASWK